MTIREPLFYLNVVAQTIFDKKGFNILVLDVRGVSSLTDYIVIAEGNVDKHVSAIAEALFKQLKEVGLLPVRTEGMKEGDWVVMDYFHIMIHLFMPGLRDKYQLEQLWKEGQIVDVHIDVHLKNNLNSAHTLKN
jgi:ribosome-associated protein